MSKWNKSYDSNRKYKKHWEEEFDWVGKAADGSENPFCKLCSKVLKPKVSYLSNHEDSKAHVQNVRQRSFDLKEKEMELIKLKRLRASQVVALKTSRHEHLGRQEQEVVDDPQQVDDGHRSQSLHHLSTHYKFRSGAALLAFLS